MKRQDTNEGRQRKRKPSANDPRTHVYQRDMKGSLTM